MFRFKSYTYSPFLLQMQWNKLLLLLNFRVILKNNKDSKIWVAPKERSMVWMHILSWLRNQKDRFDLSTERACKEKQEREVCKQRLCQGSKEGPGMQQGGYRGSLNYLSTAVWSSGCVILETFSKLKFSYVSSLKAALTGIKTTCSTCFVSHQPLLMSQQQVVKSTKIFVPLCSVQLKYLKILTLKTQRGTRMVTIERNAQI